MKTNYKLVNMYLDSRRYSVKPYLILAILFAITIIILGIAVN